MIFYRLSSLSLSSLPTLFPIHTVFYFQLLFAALSMRPQPCFTLLLLSCSPFCVLVQILSHSFLSSYLSLFPFSHQTQSSSSSHLLHSFPLLILTSYFISSALLHELLLLLLHPQHMSAWIICRPVIVARSPHAFILK